MERKAKVTQDAVNAACEQLQADNKNVTVNAVIGITGGSFSTVGAMVKLWKEDQAAQVAPLPEMPETVTKAMHKAAFDIWGTASALAGETVERVQNEAKEALEKARGELSEYASEVTRLENELEQSSIKLTDTEKRLSECDQTTTTLTTQNTALQTRLDDRDAELERLRADYDKLQTELLEIAKAKAKEEKETKESDT